MKHLIQLFFITVLFVLCLLDKADAQLSSTRIAFYSNRDGNYELYLMDYDGSNQIRITNNNAMDAVPSFSPDGRQIAFVSDRNGVSDIYKMRNDGTQTTQITINSGTVGDLAWSPLGDKIVFREVQSAGEIKSINIDGTNKINLSNNGSEDGHPSWSPDGSKIVFVSHRDANGEIYTMSANGSNVNRLTANNDNDGKPRYSPDGTKIVFVSNRDANLEIYVMNADGSNPTRLTNNTASDYYPYWSPDGSKIIFSSDIDGDSEIYVMDNNGANIVQLTNNLFDDKDPWWSNFTEFPRVKSLLPSQNALNISKSTDISATFNVAMNTSTLNASNILVYGSQSGKHAGTITLSGDTAFTFNPTTDFMAGEIVNVTLTKNITSASGDSLTNGWHWSFTIQNSVSTGTFGTILDYGTGDVPFYHVVYDIDGDGDGDVLTVNLDAYTVSVLKNNGDGTFMTRADYYVGYEPRGIFIYDVDGDGDGDVLATNRNGSTLTVMKNNGDGIFSVFANLQTGSLPWAVYAYDIDGDSDGDVLVTNSDGNSISVFRNSGNGTLTTNVDYTTGSNPRSIFVCDIDGDGDGDAVTANYSSNSISILKNNGDGTFASKSDYTTGINPFSVFLSDIDNDDDVDVVVANDGSTTVSVLKNNGDGTFTTKIDYGTGNNPVSVFVNDIDGDGDEDIVTANWGSSNISILRNNGNGVFATKVDYTTRSLPRSVYVSDLDGDGDGDVVTTSEDSDKISVLKNINNVASISGTKFNDLNNNNSKDIDEPLLSNWKIRLSGTSTDSTLTDVNGNYSFTNLQAGTYTVSEEQQAGWTQSFPLSGSYSLTVNSGDSLTGKDFGNRIITDTIFASVVGNGSITPSGNVIISYGNDTSFTITPSSGYHIDSVVVNGTRVDSLSSYTFYNIITNQTIVAYFSINEYTIIATTLGNGSIAPSDTVRKTHGSNQTFIITPNPNYHVDSMLVDGVRVDSMASYTFFNITANHTIKAYFSINYFTLTLVAVNGSVQKLPNQSQYAHGTSVQLTAVPNSTYHFLSWSGDTSGAENPITISMNRNKTITATFEANPGSISGVKFNDGNGNGMKEGEDGTMSGWKIYLFQNDLATLIDSAITTVSGYSFQNLSLGTYYVREKDSTGWIRTTANPSAIIITAGKDTTGIDFGNFKFGSISGFKFEDKDSSGIRDLGEQYISNWSINLQRNDSLIATTQTDSLNGYTFSNLTAGTYVIKEAKQTNWLQTFPANPDSYIVTITSGANATGRTFGNHYVIPAVDYVKYRTFADPCSLTQKPRTLKPVKKPGQLPYIQMPTVGNVEETTFVKIFTTSSKIKKRMKIGIPIRGITNWIEIEKATAFRNFFLCNDTSRYDIAFPFDSTRDGKNKPRAWKNNILLNPTGKKYKNNLARSLATLKLNIWASDVAVTPNDSFALGDLVYRDTGRIWNNLSLRQITELSRFRTTSAVIFEPGKADSALSLYRDYSFVNWDELDTVLTRINESFECAMDTLDTKPLKIKGCWGMKDLMPRYLFAPESLIVRTSSNEFINSDIPYEFELSQNYPNPFNPSTAIRFHIPLTPPSEGGHRGMSVTLKVYDLLGREVATLMNNEMMDEGEYEFEFDATNLASGVYFYRLTANGLDGNSTSFTDVKRMILVR